MKKQPLPPLTPDELEQQAREFDEGWRAFTGQDVDKKKETMSEQEEYYQEWCKNVPPAARKPFAELDAGTKEFIFGSMGFAAWKVARAFDALTKSVRESLNPFGYL